ncbi:hypothetical protein AALO_G00172290 [Alosa alosa]|uniref:Ig-like domain-containing protein n=1 Tax=Alosa alosa TaxID=278164 RepID=A0AAV6GB74_9TELE|nr:hypothetical protein AALO_G00172290 [Alosa alosa]
MAILGIAIFILVFILDYSACERRLILAKVGEDVSITCPCPTFIPCEANFIRWMKVAVNGSVTIINTGCGQSCRISQKIVNNSQIELTIQRVTRDDEGRYYCDKNTASVLTFRGKATYLQIKDESWSNRSEVTLLREFKRSTMKPNLYELQHGSLLCLVTGLLSPNIIIMWHSSHGRVASGQTWVSDTSKGFTAGSRLQINVTTGKNLHITQNAKGPGEEWWCEVHHDNFTLSAMSSLDNNTEWCSAVCVPEWCSAVCVPEWCSAVLYAVVSLVLLCVFSLVLLTSHWFLHSHRGVSVTTSSPSQDGAGSGARLQLTQLPTSTGQPSNSGSEVYSVLKYHSHNTVSSSAHQSDVSTSVTYSALSFQQPPPRPGRRRREKNRDWHAHIYSTVHTHDT